MKSVLFALVSLVLILCSAPAAHAASAASASPPPLLADYLPSEVTYDEAIPTPASVLGFEVGEWHVRHDQLVAYMKALAAASDRVEIESYGRTYEGRELLLMTIAHPDRLERIDEIRRAHLGRLAPSNDSNSDPGNDSATDSEHPVVVWLGYSVHGNEASGSNASLLTAYYLAAGRGPAIDAILDHAVVLIDPSINPDGLGRFASWVNSHRGRVLIGEGVHREHREAWPGGRTNHYWFDLNRDWLLLQHPESRGRIERFQAWRPNVLADFHEMGSNSTYFFQPGVPSRQNPLTPDENLELTRAIARHHADALDAKGRLYYSEETFDDFYYGKGSTYPDVHGSVGILFEQASARGHFRDTVNGDLSFRTAVENQFLTSLSTMTGAVENRAQLLDWQQRFVREARAEGAADAIAGWVFGDAKDSGRTREMLAILLGHHIEVHELTSAVEADGERFEAGSAFWVPSDQGQYRLAKSLFETRTEFTDSTFYDVSTWTLPLSFGLPYKALGARAIASDAIGDAVASADLPAGRFVDLEGAYAWAFEWNEYFAPRLLQNLLAEDFQVRAATLPFTAKTADGERRFAAGTIIVPRGLQDDRNAPRLSARMREAAGKHGVDVYGLASGLTSEGVDLGSPNIRPMTPPRPAIIVGSGVSQYEAGQAWHLLDHRFGVPTLLIEADSMAQADLAEVTHIVLVSGSYLRRWSEADVDALKDWVRGGGTVVAIKSAAAWSEKELLGIEDKDSKKSKKKKDDEDSKQARPYADHQRDVAQRLVSGTIFMAEVDLTHPIAFGVGRERLPVFRNSRVVLHPSDNLYSTPVRYLDEPLVSGFAAPRNVEALGGTSAVIVDRVGGGTVIRMADDPNFRAVWFGTSKLFVNSIFFGPMVNYTNLPDWMDGAE